jgi:hypothetical protein
MSIYILPVICRFPPVQDFNDCNLISAGFLHFLPYFLLLVQKKVAKKSTGKTNGSARFAGQRTRTLRVVENSF